MRESGVARAALTGHAMSGCGSGRQVAGTARGKAAPAGRIPGLPALRQRGAARQRVPEDEGLIQEKAEIAFHVEIADIALAAYGLYVRRKARRNQQRNDAAGKAGGLEMQLLDGLADGTVLIATLHFAKKRMRMAVDVDKGAEIDGVRMGTIGDRRFELEGLDADR